MTNESTKTIFEHYSVELRLLTSGARCAPSILFVMAVAHFLICVSPVAASDTGTKKDFHNPYSGEATYSVRDVGGCWINYGPGIIETCKSVAFLEYRPDLPRSTFNRYVATSTDPNFESIKDWLRKHLDSRRNLSATNPCGSLVLHCDYLLLYAAEKPPDTEVDDDTSPILFKRQERFQSAAIRNSLLLGVPCTPHVFGQSKDSLSADLGELKARMRFACTRRLPFHINEAAIPDTKNEVAGTKNSQ